MFKEKGDFIIPGPRPEQYMHSQRNNKLNPTTSCFPTSVAMVIHFILLKNKMTQSQIGIAENVQLEDYLTNLMKSQTIKTWMLSHVGPWTKSFYEKAWTVAKVEEKIFDDMMNKLGYDAQYVEGLTFDFICNLVYHAQIPQVIFGNFLKTSKIDGHITTVVGFNYEQKSLIINDPYGNAYTRYSSDKGCFLRYKWSDFYIRGKNAHGIPTSNLLMITQKNQVIPA